MRNLWLVVYLMLFSGVITAQPLAITQMIPQYNIRLPWGLSNLSVIGGRLYGWCTGGMQQGVSSVKGDLMYLQTSSWLSGINGEMNYAIRHPQNGTIYYTVRTKYGTRLYCYQPENNSSSEVRLTRWRGDVMHPTFSQDGMFMVFSARAGAERKDFDLWVAKWNGKNWETPLNLGKRINTSADEINPFFVDSHLFFSSNRLGAVAAGYDIYTASFMSNSVLWQVPNPPVVVSRLPQPFNTEDDELEFVTDTIARGGYWIRKHGQEVLLICLNGSMEGVMYSGRVTDVKGNPIPNAQIVVSSDGQAVFSTQSDSVGGYHFLGHKGTLYSVSFYHQGYTHAEVALPVPEGNDAHLVQESWKDVTLMNCPINTPIFLRSIFGEAVGTAILPVGHEELSPIVAFVRDNPTLHIVIAVQCKQTGDMEYDGILTKLRANELRAYFVSRLPAGVSISVQTDNSMAYNVPFEEGQTALMVILRDF